MRIRPGTVLYLLCSALLLLAMYYTSRQPPVEPVSVPEIQPPAAAPAAEPEPDKLRPRLRDLDLSLEPHLEFTLPPETLLPTEKNSTNSELFDTLSTPAQDDSRYSISGKVMLEDEPDYSLKSIEGLQLELQIKTD